MEQIVIQVSDKEKAKVLLELLSALDFVDSVKTSKTEIVKTADTVRNKTIDFFSFAGLWDDREISIESIRQKAWPRQYR